MRWTKVIAENQSFSANLAKPELLPQFRMLATMISKRSCLGARIILYNICSNPKKTW